MSPNAARRPEHKVLPAFAAPYAAPDEALAIALLANAPREAPAEARIDARATRLVEAIRAKSGGLGGIEDFLREYSRRKSSIPPSPPDFARIASTRRAARVSMRASAAAARGVCANKPAAIPSSGAA